MSCTWHVPAVVAGGPVGVDVGLEEAAAEEAAGMRRADGSTTTTTIGVAAAAVAAVAGPHAAAVEIAAAVADIPHQQQRPIRMTPEGKDYARRSRH
jgi:hypothetical protein